MLSKLILYAQFLLNKISTQLCFAIYLFHSLRFPQTNSTSNISTQIYKFHIFIYDLQKYNVIMIILIFYYISESTEFFFEKKLGSPPSNFIEKYH
jgi:hypothetical protein